MKAIRSIAASQLALIWVTPFVFAFTLPEDHSSIEIGALDEWWIAMDLLMMLTFSLALFGIIKSFFWCSWLYLAACSLDIAQYFFHDVIVLDKWTVILTDLSCALTGILIFHCCRQIYQQRSGGIPGTQSAVPEES